MDKDTITDSAAAMVPDFNSYCLQTQNNDITSRCQWESFYLLRLLYRVREVFAALMYTPQQGYIKAKSWAKKKNQQKATNPKKWIPIDCLTI